MLWFNFLLLMLFFFSFIYFNTFSVIMEFSLLEQFLTNMSLVFIFDYYSLVFCGVVSIISFSVFMFSKFYMDEEKSPLGFSLLLFLFVCSMYLLLFSPNLLMMLLGWDGLGITSYLLVIYYSSSLSSVAGMVTFILNRVGDIFFLFSISFLFFFFSWDFYFNKYSLFLLGFFFFLSFITKSAQVPFSSWLPAAMAAPTPVSSLVHSSTLVTAGVFLVIRFFFSFESSVLFLFFVSFLTLFLAGMVANLEWDMKKLIAYSTLSQLGFMMISLSMGLVFFSFFHLTTHALFKASFFMSSGVLIHGGDSTQEFRNMTNIYLSNYLSVSAVLVCVLCLVGFPFTAGFFSKDLLLDGALTFFFFFFFFFFFVMLTIGYSFRFVWYLIKMYSLSRVKFFFLYDNVYWLNFSIWLLIFMTFFFGDYFFNGVYSMKVFLITSMGWKSIFFFVFLFFSVASIFFFRYLLFYFRYFFSKMFFLNKLMASYFFFFFFSKSVLKKNDQGVEENFGPLGFNFVIYYLSFYFLQIFFFSFILYFLFFFIFLFLM